MDLGFQCKDHTRVTADALGSSHIRMANLDSFRKSGDKSSLQMEGFWSCLCDCWAVSKADRVRFRRYFGCRLSLGFLNPSTAVFNLISYPVTAFMSESVTSYPLIEILCSVFALLVSKFHRAFG